MEIEPRLHRYGSGYQIWSYVKDTDIRHGSQQAYHANGNVLVEYFRKNGECFGIYKRYNDSSITFIELSQMNINRHGLEIVFRYK
jgi:antitoxin component YwqK of YwqJK toxin-antitoxin module